MLCLETIYPLHYFIKDRNKLTTEIINSIDKNIWNEIFPDFKVFYIIIF